MRLVSNLVLAAVIAINVIALSAALGAHGGAARELIVCQHAGATSALTLFNRRLNFVFAHVSPQEKVHQCQHADARGGNYPASSPIAQVAQALVSE